MKNYRVTQKQIEDIKMGLNKFLKYVADCCTGYKQYFDNMEEANKLYMKNPDTFFDNIGIDSKSFFEKRTYYELGKTAKIVLKNVEDIHTNIIGIFINPEGDEYPVKVCEWLIYLRDFCFDGMDFLPVEKQNEKLKEYVHFDASVKRPRTYKTQAT